MTLRSSWVSNAAAWRDAVREGRIRSRREVTDAAILSAVLKRNPRRVLDVGCGEGWLARALHAHGIDVTGIDASAPLIESAQSLGGGRFLVLAYDELSSLDAEPFDVIVANFSILDDRAESLVRALRALLAPAGTLLVQTVHPSSVTEPEREGWRTETFASIEGDWREEMPWYYRTTASWVKAFEEAGWVVEEVREPAAAGAASPTSLLFVVSAPSPSSLPR